MEVKTYNPNIFVWTWDNGYLEGILHEDSPHGALTHHISAEDVIHVEGYGNFEYNEDLSSQEEDVYVEVTVGEYCSPRHIRLIFDENADL